MKTGRTCVAQRIFCPKKTNFLSKVLNHYKARVAVQVFRVRALGFDEQEICFHAQVGALQMHGTGTALGDPIEVNAALTALATKGQVSVVGFRI